MSIKSMFKRQLPKDAKVTTTMNSVDYDEIPTAVTYPTESGGTRSVKVKRTIDGDLIPETGHTIDGDHYYPDQKLDWM